MQGGSPRRSSSARRRSRRARLSANPHYLFWALFELGWARYFAGDLERAIEACEESARVGGRLTGGTMPAAGGGPGWALGGDALRARRVERGFETMRALGGDELEYAIPVERCFDWEILALAELGARRPGGGRGLRARAPRSWPPSLGPAACPRRWPRAPGAALLLAAGRRRAAQPPRRRSPRTARRRRRPAAGGVRAQPRGPRAGRRGRAQGGDRGAARGRARSSTPAARVRERDALRRELRKLGARAEARGPAAARTPASRR